MLWKLFLAYLHAELYGLKGVKFQTRIHSIHPCNGPKITLVQLSDSHETDKWL